MFWNMKKPEKDLAALNSFALQGTHLTPLLQCG